MDIKHKALPLSIKAVAADGFLLETPNKKGELGKRFAGSLSPAGFTPLDEYTNGRPALVMAIDPGYPAMLVFWRVKRPPRSLEIT